MICDFLIAKFNKDLSISTLNVLRSGLSFFCNNAELSIGENPSIIRLFKAFYRLRPKVSRYITFWPVQKVLKLLASWHPANDLALKNLTLKTLALIALTCSDRCQTLHAMNIEDINIDNEEISFVIHKELKTSRYKRRPHVVTCIKSDNPALNVCEYVQAYMDRIRTLREEAVTKGGKKPIELFLSWKTGLPVSKPTLTRWLKLVLQMSGIDTKKYAAHSFRGAGLSEAYAKGASLSQIMEAGNWSNTDTFKTYYNKRTDNNPVGRLILQSFEANDNT